MSGGRQAGDTCPKCVDRRGRITTTRRIRKADVDSHDGMDRGAQFATDYSCDHGHSWRETFPSALPPDAEREPGSS